ncbi:MAG: Na+/H+ antiporter NhaC family protein [Capnocytophaga sp.]|nr:Na+/H+ antiporter NhaC family protein [Capnocytophaga sp.]
MAKPTFISIIPLLVFIVVFLGAGIYFDDFYSFPSPLAALVGVVVALVLYRSTFEEKVGIFLKGCGDNKVLTMCVIYLLAGAFATVTKASGSVDSIVNLGISYISPAYYPVGVFVIASFLSFASGTSVGSIMTLGPIVVDLALQSDSNMSLIGASLLSGAMFGDNLSLISDTTIAATQTMDCSMDDKMKANSRIAFPAALLTILVLFLLGGNATGTEAALAAKDYNLILITPYLLVIVLSVVGVNVFISLFAGIVLSGIIGMAYGQFDFLTYAKVAYEGFLSMMDVFLLAMFAGGLSAMVDRFGGIQYMMNSIRRHISSARSGLLGIGFLVSAVNLCVANNTVSILIASRLSKQIVDRFGIRKQYAASVLDIFSCYVQGIVPYGAQLLVLMSLSHGNINYWELLSYVVYLHLLLLATLIFIVFVMDASKQ